MLNYLIRVISIIVFLTIIAFAVGAATLYFSRTDIAPVKVEKAEQSLPRGSFAPKEGHYQMLDSGLLDLQYVAPKLGVPDLRPYLAYRGHNLRPDAKDSRVLFFSLGSGAIFPVNASDKQYLVMTGKPTDPFALSAQETSLWFQPEIKTGGIEIHVSIRGENGEVSDQPLEKGRFLLAEKPLALEAKNFMLKDQKVDATLLSRQKARWSGLDQFLEDRGGDEYEKWHGKQRIVFGVGEEAYSIYLGVNDVMIWKNDRWQIPLKGEDTTPFPLARLSKIDDRLMGIEIYDISGKFKLNLNLLKVQEPPQNPSMLDRDFQFLGSRSKVHSMFKINNKREMVGEGDWYVLTPDGWRKLRTSKEIDAYVDGQIQGPLLTLDKIERDAEDSWFSATLYSPSRAVATPIKIPLKISVPDEKSAPLKPEPIPQTSIPRG